MTEARARTGRKRSEASRAAILKAALELLHERSYAEVTADEIAERAGTSKQTMYRWWQSKADVVLEALREHARTIDAPELGSLEKDLDVFLASSFRLLNGPQGTASVLKGLMAEAQLDPNFAPRFAKFIASRRETLASIFHRHVRGKKALVEAAVDMAYGTLWYRLLIGHAKLDRELASELARLISKCFS
ncbi:MAG: TetR/AcrR family transcriptional regulator [Polyangiaceae bacterium]